MCAWVSNLEEGQLLCFRPEQTVVEDLCPRRPGREEVTTEVMQNTTAASHHPPTCKMPGVLSSR